MVKLTQYTTCEREFFMVEQQKKEGSQTAQVHFFYPAAPGHTVSLSGVFNDWDPAKTPMVYSAADAGYSCTLSLAKGEYEYKLVVDGEWLLDEENPNFVSNDFGTLNSLLKVN